MAGLEPQDRVLGHRAGDRRVLHVHLAAVAQAGDAGDHVLAADLVEVVAQHLHHRVLARAPDAAREVHAAFPQADLAAGEALFAEPAEPLVLRGDHLRGAGHARVMEPGVARRLARRRVARVHPVTLEVEVLVRERAERVADLVQRDQRALRRAARRGRVRAADAAVGEAVEDRQRLQVLRRARDAEHRRDVGVQDAVVRLAARLARVGRARRVVRRQRGGVAVGRRGAVDHAARERARCSRCPTRGCRTCAARCSWC